MPNPTCAAHPPRPSHATATGRTARRLRAAGALTLAAALAACGGSSANRAPVEYRGSTPVAPGPTAAGGILAYEGYEAAVARDGDTVSSVASRVGLSAAELGAYNGLQPATALRAGDELVLPPRPGGYGGTRVASAAGTIDTTPATPDTAGPAASALPGSGPVVAGPLGATTGTGTPDAATTEDGFSLDAIEAAIDQPAPAAGDAATPGATGIVADGAGAADGVADSAAGAAAAGGTAGGTAVAAADPAPTARPIFEPAPDTQAADAASTSLPGTADLTPPPSSADPLPPSPEGATPPPSPELGRFQTTGPEQRPAPETLEAQRAAVEADKAAADELALADQATRDGPPAVDLGIAFRRPVSGPVLVPYNVSNAGPRNEGVDFAADPGTTVVASADGEVALVSRSLGGLGTIVLIRHRGDLLTVYGRVDDVSVVKGARVAAGQPIGVVAPGDGSGPPKMHFEIRRGADSVNPENYI
ncbi:MAG: peptidoglycan DD-metalloendopeptidase family protein [Pseudomonadota bacterium]